MLDNLMRYLTVALPQMRETESTLEREAALAQAYLNIQEDTNGSPTRVHRRYTGGIARRPHALDGAVDPG
jgi:hypothetical protein